MNNICAKCGASFADGQLFCTCCGTRRSESIASQSGQQYCSSCGSPLAPGSGFCTKCGARSGQPGDSTPPAHPAPPLPPLRLPAASNVASSQPAAKKSSSLGFKLVVMAACVLVMAALALGAGVAYLGYRAKKKVEAVKQAYKNDDLAGIVGAVIGKDSSPQPLPNWKPASPELLSSPASKVPLRVSLRLVDTGTEPLRGDYESIFVLDSITDQTVHFRGSQEFPAGAGGLLPGGSSNTQESKKIQCGRMESLTDLQNSTEADSYFCRQGESENHPGRTAMSLSRKTLAELKTTGQAEITYREDPLKAILKSFKKAMSSDSGASNAEATTDLMKKMMSLAPGGGGGSTDSPPLKCVLHRVGLADVAFPVLINDHPAELPTIDTTANLQDDPAAEPHLYVLDDPENPLVLAVASKHGHGQITKIYWNASKDEEPNRLEKDLEKYGRAKVYDLYFDFRKDVLKPESKKVLDQIAQVMRDHPDWKLGIEGHTDNIGGDAFNLDLSKRRSESVKQAIAAQYQVAPERFSTAGFGASSPVATNETLEGRALNRRVELVRQ